MVVKKKINILIPADVPQHMTEIFSENMHVITRGTGRLYMFAADQKIEHLNDDFYGSGIDRQANNPEHIFNIARDGSCGALAVHAGLLARYGAAYNTVNYIVKLNGKTNLGQSGIDPVSALLWDVQDALNMALEHDLNIRGVGFTLYIGGQQESLMMAQAAQVIAQAHRQGLVAVLWVYPRAAHLKDLGAPALLAGAAGLGNALGADFVKIQMSPAEHIDSMQALAIATEAAGNTGVLVSGGEYMPVDELLKRVHEQITQAGAAGCAIGRNIFKRSHGQAVALSKALAALVYDNASYQEALDIVQVGR